MKCIYLTTYIFILQLGLHKKPVKTPNVMLCSFSIDYIIVYYFIYVMLIGAVFLQLYSFTAQQICAPLSELTKSHFCVKRAVEEKKSVREKAKNDEMSAMQSFKEKTAVEEVYTKVICYQIAYLYDHSACCSLYVDLIF